MHFHKKLIPAKYVKRAGPMSATMPATMCNNMSDKNKRNLENLRVNVQESKGKCVKI